MSKNRADLENGGNTGVSREFLNEKSHNDRQNEPFYFLNIFKPRGITSFDVIYRLRKRLKIKKIGHSGTLDPMAEGVMQVGVGKATRLLDYLGSDKKYAAKIRFGYFSTTADAEGDITPFNMPDFDEQSLLSALNSMIGEIEQVPPVYSAIKVDGKKLCDLARKAVKNKKGVKNEPFEKNVNCTETLMVSDKEPVLQCLNQDAAKDCGAPKNENPCCMSNLDVLIKNTNSNLVGVEIPKRKVKIYDAKLLNFVKNSYEAEIEISCSKGTYIRTFALDLAKKLNTSAYLTSLIRTQAGNFDIKDSILIDDASAQHTIKPHLALNLPVYELNETEYKKVLNGVSFVPEAFATSADTLMLVFQNNLVSIGVLSDNMIVCKKVFK